jgi:hypothetical protein
VHGTQLISFNLVVGAVKLPGEAKQNNLPPKCGQLIDAGGSGDGSLANQISQFLFMFTNFALVNKTSRFIPH